MDYNTIEFDKLNHIHFAKELIESHSFIRSFNKEYGTTDDGPVKYFKCKHCKAIVCVNVDNKNIYFSCFNDNILQNMSMMCDQILIQNILT